jgi:phosphate transport system permease protein
MSASIRPPQKSSGRSSATLLRQGDIVFQVFCAAAALFLPALLILILAYLTRDASESIRTFGLSFFTSTDWDTTHSQYGAAPFIVGTVLTSTIAMVIAVPISVGAATYLAEIAPGSLRRIASFLIELLAAIPSVVYGFWGIFYLVPLMQSLFEWLHIQNASGRGIFTASVVLAIMIVPYIAAITFDVCRAVPQSQRQGALALGSTRWQMIWRVVLPYARPGIIGGCFLALGRAIGETMAVAMVIGNKTQLTWDIFDIGSTIPSLVASQLPTAPSPLQVSALIELGLALFMITVVINILARLLLWRVGRASKGSPSLFRRAAPKPGVNAGLHSAPLGMIVTPAQRRMASMTNHAMTLLLGACLVITLIPLFHIFGYITFRGFNSVNRAFFTNLPVDDTPGLGHALIGTVILVAMATVAAVPIGLLAALFLTEYRTHRLVPLVRFVNELLNGVPSIIVGIFAYALLVHSFGFSAWAGATALAVIMIPIVVRSAEEALKLVPSALRYGSYALGASHAQTVVRVIIPTALPTIITGVFLAIARIAGETAPLLFTAFASSYWPRSLSDRMPNLTYYIYNYSMGDSSKEHGQAWAGALVLLIFVMLLNVGIRIITGKRVLQATRAD